MTQLYTENSSSLVGDVRWSKMVINAPENTEQAEKKVYRTAEQFFFELSELMKEYGVIKIDVCVDPYAYAESLNKETPQQ